MIDPFLTTFASVYAPQAPNFRFLHFEILISIVKSAETMFTNKKCSRASLSKPGYVPSQNTKFSKIFPNWIYAELDICRSITVRKIGVFTASDFKLT